MTVTYTIADLDLIPADLLVRALGLDWDRSHGGSDASYTATWRDRAGHVWDLHVYGCIVGTRLVLWSRTDEADVADVTVRYLVDIVDDIRAYAEELAEELGG
jgi:hypothetical protein